MTGRLIGVGVGPGDPDLITVKGRDALLAADALFVPVSVTTTGDDADAGAAPAPGYAQRVVTAHVPHATPITRLPFALTGEARAASWRTAADRVAEVVEAGRTAAFATIGDPNVYSTFTHLAREVTRRCPAAAVSTVPGITAMQDLAARTSTVLIEHDESLALLPLTAGLDRVRDALATADTVVLYKGGRHLPEVQRLLEEEDRLATAVFGARLGLDDQDVRDQLPRSPAPYLSTVIVPPSHKDPA